LPCHLVDNAAEVVDFFFERCDGTKLLIHPRRDKCHFDVLEVAPGQKPRPVVPKKGPGQSDGRGTFKRVMAGTYSDCALTDTAVAASASAAASGTAAASAAVAASASAAVATDRRLPAADWAMSSARPQPCHAGPGKQHTHSQCRSRL
jgi:hypothetical protein